jgi:hypothetical protein
VEDGSSCSSSATNPSAVWGRWVSSSRSNVGNAFITQRMRVPPLFSTSGNGSRPRSGGSPFHEYASSWMRDRLTSRGEPLCPHVRELYEGHLRRHINPRFRTVAVADITTPAVRAWYSDLRDCGPGGSTTAKYYRLLRSILSTAVEDGLIPANRPCQTCSSRRCHPAPLAGRRSARRLRRTPQRRDLRAHASRRRPLRRHGHRRTAAPAGRPRRGPHRSAEDRSRKADRHDPAIAHRRPSGPPRALVDADPDALLVVGEKGAPLRPHVWQNAWDAAYVPRPRGCAIHGQ